MNCEYCQSPAHIWFQCPKKPDGWKPARLTKFEVADYSPDVDGRAELGKGKKSRHGPQSKSTAARKDVQSVRSGALSEAKTVQHGDPTPRKLADHSQPVAGTQALPVDTNSRPGLATGNSPTSAGTVGEKDRQPFNKKAWMREYMREHRRGIRRRGAKAK